MCSGSCVSTHGRGGQPWLTRGGQKMDPVEQFSSSTLAWVPPRAACALNCCDTSLDPWKGQRLAICHSHKSKMCKRVLKGQTRNTRRDGEIDRFPFLFVCMLYARPFLMCMQVCVFMCACMRVCRSQTVTLGSSCSSFSTFLRQGVSVNSKLAPWATPGWPVSFVRSLSQPAERWGCRHMLVCLAF